MPWDKELIARYPRLTDQSIRGRMVREIAERAWHMRHDPAAPRWNEVNPELRSWWCDMTDTILKAAANRKEALVKQTQQPTPFLPGGRGAGDFD